MPPVTSTAPAPSRPNAAPGRGLLAVLAQPLRLMRNRRNAASLLNADRRLLADIGLTRADVAATLRQPFADPSCDLSRIAEERRQTARALAGRRLAETTGIDPA